MSILRGLPIDLPHFIFVHAYKRVRFLCAHIKVRVLIACVCACVRGDMAGYSVHSQSQGLVWGERSPSVGSSVAFLWTEMQVMRIQAQPIRLPCVCCIYASPCECMHAYMHSYTQTPAHSRTVCMHTSAGTQICMHACIHTYIHAYICA